MILEEVAKRYVDVFFGPLLIHFNTDYSNTEIASRKTWYVGRKISVICSEGCTLYGYNGIRTSVFDALRPTPELSFALRSLGCTNWSIREEVDEN